MGDLKVINANIGKTNVVSFEDFHENSITTLNNIIEMILPMCGPNALTDLVITQQSSGNYMGNIFSNDGIHLLKSISYMSPIQTYIADYIRYIAERVESAAADGTSTAIYIAANLLINLLDEVSRKRKLILFDKEMPSINKTRLIMNDVQTINRMSKYFINTLLFSLENMKIDVKTVDLELKKTIISRLAYTTSKGNKLLTQYAVDLFVNLPEELYEHISYKRADRETDDDFIIDDPEYDALVNVVPSASVQYNSKLNTELIWDDCELLVCPNIYESGLFVNEYMIRRVAGVYGDSTKPLVILYTGANDHDIIGLEKIIDGHNVALCRHTVYTQAFINNPLELNIIQALGNIDPHRQLSIEEVELSIIHDVKCRIYGNELYIYHLFESDSYIHPSYMNNDHPAYNKLKLDIEEEIKRLKKSHGKDIVRSNLNEFVRLYRLLVCSRLPILTIGGSTVNHLANINVVDDVLGVVSVAMRHGVIIDMIPKLHYVIKDMQANGEIVINHYTNSWLYQFNKSIEDFARLTYNLENTDNLLTSFDSDVIDSSLDMISMDDVKPHYPFTYDLKLYSFDSDEWYEYTGKSTSHIRVVQSYKAIHETFTRLLETIPKLISTDKIIVIGGVMNTTKGVQ